MGNDHGDFISGSRNLSYNIPYAMILDWQIRENLIIRTWVDITHGPM